MYIQSCHWQSCGNRWYLCWVKKRFEWHLPIEDRPANTCREYKRWRDHYWNDATWCKIRPSWFLSYKESPTGLILFLFFIRWSMFFLGFRRAWRTHTSHIYRRWNDWTAKLVKVLNKSNQKSTKEMRNYKRSI